MLNSRNERDRTAVIEEAVAVVENGMKTVSANRNFFIVSLLLLLVVFFWTIDIELHYKSQPLTIAVRTLSSSAK